MDSFKSFDIPALIALIFCSSASALWGNVLMWQKKSAFASSLSHIVFLGTVSAYILTSSTNDIILATGAIASALMAALLIHILNVKLKLEINASIGFVFSLMLAIAVILLDITGNINSAITPHNIIFGNIENIIWNDRFPPEVWFIIIISLLSFIVFASLKKEIISISFDDAFAHSSGIKVNLLRNIITFFICLVAVSAFKIMGAIVIVSLLSAPAAISCFISNNIRQQLHLSILVAVVCSVVGYIISSPLSIIYNYPSINSGGAIASLLFFVLLTTIAIKTVLENKRKI